MKHTLFTHSLIVLLLVVVLIADYSYAEQAPPPKEAVPGRVAVPGKEAIPQKEASPQKEALPPQGIDNPDINRGLRLARKLYRERNYEGASAVLEALYELHPNDEMVYSQLRSCYFHLKYWEKLVELSRRFVANHPTHIGFRLHLAEVLMYSGQRAAADSAYTEALNLAAENDSAQCLQVVRSMMGTSFNDRALAIIDDYRRRSGLDNMFSMERGMVLEKQSRFSEATDEYYRVLVDTTRQRGTAEKKVLGLLLNDKSSTAAEDALLSRARDSLDVRAMSLLASHYIRSGRFEEAFEFAITEDSVLGLNGMTILSLMQTCVQRELPSEALSLGDYILSHHNDKPVALEARFAYADALVQLERYEDAIAAYDTVVAQSQVDKECSRALYEIGSIHLNQLHDFPAALSCFDSVVNYYKAGRGYLYSTLGRPYCFLRQGELKQARIAFDQLLSRRLNDDMREEALYHVGLLMFIDKQYDSARVAFNRLLVEHPRGFFVNDAVHLMVQMDEADEAKELLYDYSSALVFEQMFAWDSVVVRLEQIADAENPALADLALFRLMELSLEQFDSRVALTYFDRLETDHPESYYYPYGLKMKADLLLIESESADEANQIYRRLLREFPDYPFASEVRKRLRELEVDSQIG